MNANAAGRQDPFSVLGVAARFNLDLPQLAERHRELSRALHPDRFQGAGASERREALGRAISVNDAWRTLKDPVLRGQALLEHFGVATDEKSEPPASQELLLEIMEAREDLGRVRSQADAVSLAAYRERFEQRQSNILAELVSQFEALSGAAAGAAQPGQAAALRQKLAELRYCQRLLEEVSNLEDELS